MQLLTQLSTGHYGINGKPVYKMVTVERETLNLSKGKFAVRHGIDRKSQYKFEAGQNRSLAMAIRQLKALGHDVNIYAL